MEALILLIAEFIFAPLVGALTTITGLAASLVIAALQGVVALVRGGRRAAAVTADSRVKHGEARPGRRSKRLPASIEGEKADGRATVRRRVGRLIPGLLLGIVGLLVAVALCLNVFMFESTVRWILARVDAKTGIQVTFDSADGNLITGRVELFGARARREKSDTSEFSLQVGEAVIDLSLWRLPVGGARIDELRLRGVDGSFTRTGLPDEVKPKQQFIINRCLLEDVNITVADHTRSGEPVITEVKVEELESSPLRSRWAIFDILFRTNARGTLDGQAFTLESREVSGGRETRWVAESVPVAKAAAYAGEPFNWIEDGVMDVDITDRWRLDGDVGIEMHYDLVFHGIRAAVPARATPSVKAVATPVVAYMNDHGERLPIAFDFVMDKDRFHGAYSVEAAGLWEAFSRAVVDEFAALTGVDSRVIRERSREGLQRIKGFLDKRRKNDP